MINSRSLNDLLLPVHELAQKLIDECTAQGIDLLVTSTYRDNECQEAIYQQGRTTAGNIVTNARGGQSYHQFKCAFDFCPLVNGKCDWNDASLFERIGVMAEGLGMEWAGRWTGSMRETAHIQWTGGLTLADLQDGQMPQAQGVA